jgi:hypothetical protein
MAVVGPESLDNLSHDRGLETARQLLAANKSLAQKALGRYIENLKAVQILDLTVPEDQLSSEERRLRNDWLELLKAEFPEKLASLI